MSLKKGGLRGSLRNISTGVNAIPDSETLRYPIDEGSGQTWADAIGSNNASLNFSTWESASAWFNGNASVFDGTDDLATASANSGMGPTDSFSVGIQLRADGIQTGTQIFTNRVSSSNAYLVTVTDENTAAFEIQAWHYDGSILSPVGVPINADNILGVMFTYDNGTHNVYTDTSTGSATTAVGTVDGTNGSYYAASADSTDRKYFAGGIGRVSIYNKVLNSTERDEYFFNDL